MKAEHIIVTCVLGLGIFLALSPTFLYEASELEPALTIDDLSTAQVEALNAGPFAKTRQSAEPVQLADAELIGKDLIIVGVYNKPATIGNFSITPEGTKDVVTARLSENGTWLWVNTGGGVQRESHVRLQVENGSMQLTLRSAGNSTWGDHKVRSWSSIDQTPMYAIFDPTNGTWTDAWPDAIQTSITGDGEESLWCGF